jgi:uncharacterized glyoxalase superfamily protein PhnB
MEEALEYYAGVLGFEIIKNDHRDHQFVLLQQEYFPIALHRVENLEKAETRVILGIAVQDLAKNLKELDAKGVKVVHNTPQKFFGGVYAGIHDPSGNMLELIEWEPVQWDLYAFKK